VSEAETKEKLREWIVNRSKKAVRREELTDETPIVESGLLSSLDIVEFVLYIESLTGKEIDAEELEPAAFTNTNAMYATFFASEQ
jgi:acyl carrier protein